MTARRLLGDRFNLATSATTAAVRVNMKNAVGVTFVLIGATSGAATITEATATSGGSSQNLAAGVTEYFTQNNGLWTRVTQAAAATVTAATGGLLAVYVPSVALSAGFSYLAISHASGSFVYILADLQLKRDPANLVAVTA